MHLYNVFRYENVTVVLPFLNLINYIVNTFLGSGIY